MAAILLSSCHAQNAYYWFIAQVIMKRLFGHEEPAQGRSLNDILHKIDGLYQERYTHHTRTHTHTHHTSHITHTHTHHTNTHVIMYSERVVLFGGNFRM